MPYYAWGLGYNNNSANDVDPLGYFDELEENDRELTLRRGIVPTAESGASLIHKQALGTGGYDPDEGVYTSFFESAPVDRQVPWRSIEMRRTGWLGALNGVGLTMFGELYGIELYAPRISSAGPSSFVNQNRRIFKVRSPLAKRAFQWIGPTTCGGHFAFATPCVSRYGEAFLLNASSRRRAVLEAEDDEYLISISLPSGETAEKFWVLDGSYSYRQSAGTSTDSYFFLLATTSGKTFVRGVGQTGVNPRGFSFWGNDPPSYLSEWTLLTTGVVNGRFLSSGDARWPVSQPPPRIIVSPPQSGGNPGIPKESARIVAEWYPDGDKWQLYQFYIAHPGSGYTSPPSISFDPAPVSGTPTRVELQLFESSIRKQMQDDTFTSRLTETQVGEAYRFTVPPTSFIRSANSLYGYSGDPADRTSRVAVSENYRTGNFQNNGMFGWVANNSQSYFRSTIGGVADTVTAYGSSGGSMHLLATDGRLYKLPPPGGSSSGPELVSGGEWVSIAQSHGTLAAVNKNGGLYTWGDTPGLYGDGTTSVRSSPVRVAPEAEWVDCVGGWGNRPLFIAIRKDATCRGIDEPMPLWPDSYFES
jgi:hypothetical protein